MQTNERGTDGVLDSTFATDAEPDEHEESGEGEGSAEQETKPEGQPNKVSLSRRAKARERDERILAEIASSREEAAARDREYREHLESIRRENAELRGQVSAYASRPAPESRRDSLPDPEALEREALEALDRKDLTTYQRKMREAAKADVMREIAPRFQQQGTAQGPQTNPLLVATAAQYGDVMANPLAFDVAQAHDKDLARKGIPEGPERWKQAFEAGRKYIGGNVKQGNGPTYSQRNREVVGGLPANGSGNARGSSGEPGVILTAEERATAKKYRLSEADYAKELAAMHPDRIVR